MCRFIAFATDLSPGAPCGDIRDATDELAGDAGLCCELLSSKHLQMMRLT